ncbi:hypothetical protein ACFYO2_40510, partial [Streptomyces sp. NPDC006602]
MVRRQTGPYWIGGGADATVTGSGDARADDGSRLPTWQAARAYAEACGADLVQAERLWCRARYRARQQHQLRRAGSRPETVMDFADLRQAMVELRECCGGLAEHECVLTCVSEYRRSRSAAEWCFPLDGN